MVALALGGPRVAAAPARPALARSPLRLSSRVALPAGARAAGAPAARLPHAPSRASFAAPLRAAAPHGVSIGGRAATRPSRAAIGRRALAARPFAARREGGPGGSKGEASESESESEEEEEDEDDESADEESDGESDLEEGSDEENEEGEEEEKEASGATGEADERAKEEAARARGEDAGGSGQRQAREASVVSDDARRVDAAADGAVGSSAAPSPAAAPAVALAASGIPPAAGRVPSGTSRAPPAPPPSPRYLPSEALRIARSGPLLRDLIFRRIEQTGSRTPLLAGPAVPPDEWLRRAQGRLGMPMPGEEEAKGVTDDEGMVLAAEILEADGVPPPRWDYGIMPLRGECVPAEVTLAPRPPDPAGPFGWAALPMRPDELLHGIHVRTWTSPYYDPSAPFWDIQMRCHRGHWLAGGYQGWKAYVVEREPEGNAASQGSREAEGAAPAGSPPADASPADAPSVATRSADAPPADAPSVATRSADAPPGATSPAAAAPAAARLSAPSSAPSASSSSASSQSDGSMAPSASPVKTPGYLRPRTGRVFRVSLPHPGLSTYGEDYLGGGVGLGLFEPRRINRRAIATGNIDLVGYDQIFQALFEAYEEKSPVGWWLEEGDPGKLEGPRFGRPLAPDGGPYPQGADPQPATAAEAARGLLAPYAPSADNDIVETDTLREADPEGYFVEVQRARALALAAARASPVARELIARESARARDRRRQRLAEALRAADRENSGSGLRGALARGGGGVRAFFGRLFGRGGKGEGGAGAPHRGTGGRAETGEEGGSRAATGAGAGRAVGDARAGEVWAPSGPEAPQRAHGERETRGGGGGAARRADGVDGDAASAPARGDAPAAAPARAPVRAAASSSPSPDSVPLPLIPRYLDLEHSPETLRAARLAYACPADDSLRVTFVDETRSPLESPAAVALLALSLPPLTLGLLVRVVPALWSLLRIRRLNVPRDMHAALSFAESKGSARVDGSTGVRLSDVGGLQEVVGELWEAVSFLKDPAAFGRLGARPPGGILLEGPPGTGKTLLAKALAGEAGVPFYEASGSEFVEAVVGVGAARVRHLFARAAARAPAVVFVDELDALGAARARTGGGADEEREQALNQLLCQLDGFAPRAGVLLVAATNRASLLDPALLRPGRFDRHLLVPLPDEDAREDVLRVRARGLTLGPDVDLAALARDTPGLSGAELGALLNEAAYAADARRAAAIEMRDLREACSRITEGAAFEPPRKDPDELPRLAAAEAAVAVVANALRVAARSAPSGGRFGDGEAGGIAGSDGRVGSSASRVSADASDAPGAAGAGPAAASSPPYALERPELCSVEARASGLARTRFRRLEPEVYTLATEGRLRARLRVLLARRAGQLALCGRGHDDDHAAASVRKAAALALRSIAMYGFALVERRGGEGCDGREGRGEKGQREGRGASDAAERAVAAEGPSPSASSSPADLLSSPFVPLPYCPPRLSESGEALRTREGGSMARGLVDLDATGEPDPPAAEAPPPPTDLARARVERRVARAVRAAAEDALRIALKRRETLRRLAERLVEAKTVQGDELQRFLDDAEVEARAWEERWGRGERKGEGEGDAVDAGAEEEDRPASSSSARPSLYDSFPPTASLSPRALRTLVESLLPPPTEDWEVQASVEAAMRRVRTLRASYVPKPDERRNSGVRDALF